jgi:hypothetical protein
MGQVEMKCILNIGKKYFYIGQVSDVAHGPLVLYEMAKLPDSNHESQNTSKNYKSE